MEATFDAVTEAEAVRTVVDRYESQRGPWVVTANLDHLRRYQQDPTARNLIDDADLVVADGMPLVWASWISGTPLPERVAGSNMVWSISEAASVAGRSIFLLGGDPGVSVRAAHILQERYPGLRVAGTLCPPFGFEQNPDEMEKIERELNLANPDIVFVALGFPKQDLLIRRLRPMLPDTSFIGVGISLSFVTQKVPRAPAWIRRTGLEWLYRLIQEPRRLARRYLLEGLPFSLRLFAGATAHRVRGADATSRWGWEPAG